eukprot:477639-Pyramimonas_sp.AAC.1
MYTHAVSFSWSACQRGRSCRQDRGGRACTHVVARPTPPGGAGRGPRLGPPLLGAGGSALREDPRAR